MKKGTHPTYDLNTKATCACGAVFMIGSTMPEIKMEICSQCHPFYTGNEKVMDTAGRVDRFNKRKAATVKAKK
ncbi:MAG: large subunit ribosomal protein [Patescibacteria group bacterium]|nr:large subunit ribosomal protein [Patescibacteria group bacterium]